MRLNRKDILPFYILFSFTLIFGIGSLFSVFPSLILVFINLIFLSLLLGDLKITLYTGLAISLIFSALWFTPYIKNDFPSKNLVYFGCMVLFIVCTGFSLFLININYRTNQSLKHFFLLYENATEGIIIADELGKIIMANPTACNLFRYSEKELFNHPIEILIPLKVRNDHPQKRMNYIKNPSNREMGRGRDLLALRKDGTEFPVEISLSSYKDRRKTYVIAFIVDITVRKINEKQIRENNVALEKLSSELSLLNNQLEKKVEERTLVLITVMKNLEKSQQELNDALNKEKELGEIKSRFVSMASHEFRTPLSTVLSSASLLERYKADEDEPKRERHIIKIKESVRHLNDILEDFLSLGKLDENKIGLNFSEVNLREIIEQIIEEVSVLKKPEQKIEMHYEGKEQGITDKNLLKNICINLLTNAIKFSSADDIISIAGKNEAGILSLSIKDNGIGIPKEDLEYLFSTFFRSKNAINIQGTGLGLHIVKRYLNLLQGEIVIKSELSKGTLVNITLPTKNNIT